MVCGFDFDEIFNKMLKVWEEESRKVYFDCLVLVFIVDRFELFNIWMKLYF